MKNKEQKEIYKLIQLEETYDLENYSIFELLADQQNKGSLLENPDKEYKGLLKKKLSIYNKQPIFELSDAKDCLHTICKHTKVAMSKNKKKLYVTEYGIAKGIGNFDKFEIKEVLKKSTAKVFEVCHGWDSYPENGESHQFYCFPNYYKALYLFYFFSADSEGNNAFIVDDVFLGNYAFEIMEEIENTRRRTEYMCRIHACNFCFFCTF